MFSKLFEMFSRLFDTHLQLNPVQYMNKMSVKQLLTASLGTETTEGRDGGGQADTQFCIHRGRES